MTYLHINYSSYSKAITKATEHLCLHKLFLFYCPNFLYIHKFAFNMWFQHLLHWDKRKKEYLLSRENHIEMNLNFVNILKMLCLIISLLENMYKELDILCDMWWLHDKMEASWTNLMCLYLFQVSFEGIWLITIYLVSQVAMF